MKKRGRRFIEKSCLEAAGFLEKKVEDTHLFSCVISPFIFLFGFCFDS